MRFDRLAPTANKNFVQNAPAGTLTPCSVIYPVECCLLTGIETKLVYDSFFCGAPAPNLLSGQGCADLAFSFTPLIACNTAHWTFGERCSIVCQLALKSGGIIHCVSYESLEPWVFDRILVEGLIDQQDDGEIRIGLLKLRYRIEENTSPVEVGYLGAVLSA